VSAVSVFRGLLLCLFICEFVEVPGRCPVKNKGQKGCRLFDPDAHEGANVFLSCLEFTVIPVRAQSRRKKNSGPALPASPINSGGAIMHKPFSLPRGVVPVPEAAASVGRTSSALGRWIRSGQLPACRIGEGVYLVRLDDVARVAAFQVTGRPRKTGKRGAA